MIYEFKDRVSHIYQLDSNYHSSTNKLYLDKLKGSFPSPSEMSSYDRYDYTYYLKEISNLPETNKGILKHFYKNPAHLFQIKKKDFDFTLNPFFNFIVGHEYEEDSFKFLNKRGLELWGSLDNKFYFYSAIHENQANFLNYIQEQIDINGSIPGQGHFKPFQSSVISAFNGYDFANSRAFIGYKTSKHTHLELGHGNHFIGNGIRSLLLSDYAHNYFYLSFNIDVWKFNYQSIIAELSPFSSQQTVGNVLLPKKYMASHYLSYKLSPKLEVGLFESVIFARENQFEFQYLNPLILYRTIEALLDSPDNVLLGMNINFHLLKRTSLYSQFLLDELKTSEIFSGDQWWGNKWAFQFGIKSFNVFNINTLDIQLEYNRVRPYTYSHNVALDEFKDLSLTSYSHFNQALAHPLGANFSEYLLNIKYRLSKKLFLRLQYLYTEVGKDVSDLNFGSNILLNNSNRTSDFGIEHLQGANSQISSLDIKISFSIFQELFVDLYMKLRSDSNEVLGNTETNYWGLGLRYNIVNTSIDY